jgi:serine/threonine protein kinase
MADDPLIGFTVDGIRFDSLLGRGAMGAVYKGVQVGLDRHVAIKIIAPHLAQDESYISRFRREAQTLGRLVHPNVIACHDTVHCRGPHGNDLVLMILEFVDGWSLGSLLKKKHRMSAKQMLEFHRQAAEGLAAAHKLGIIHRDIKPDNIMITRKGQAKLADFGLAKSDDSAMLTQTGAILGSPAYMSPEACRGEQPSAASDLYSLGCSLFHGLTGVTPYKATSAVQALHQHIHAPIPKLSARRPDLKSLNDLLEKLLAKRASDRYDDAAVLARAIKSAMALIPAEALAGISTVEPRVSDAVVHAATDVTAHATATIPPAQNNKASAADRKTTRNKWPWLIAGGAAVVISLLLISANQEPVTQTITIDHTITNTLDSVESLLSQGQRSAAEVLFNQLSPEQLASAEPLAPRIAAIKQQLAVPVPPPAPATTTQSTRERLKQAEDLAAEGRIDEADELLNSFKPSADMAARSDGLRQKLRAAFQDKDERSQHNLSAAEMLIAQGQLAQARKILESTTPPRLDREQNKRYFTLLDKTKSVMSQGDKTTLTIGTPGFGEQALSNGYFALPFGLPAKTPAVFMGRDARVHLSLPTPGVVGKDGVIVFLHVSDACAVRCTLISAKNRHERPAQKIDGAQWFPLQIALDAAEPITAIELACEKNAANKPVFLHATHAVFTAGRSARLSDLAVVPGGLQPLPVSVSLRPDSANDYRAMLARISRNSPAFATLDQIKIAVPAGTKQAGQFTYDIASNALNLTTQPSDSPFLFYDNSSASLDQTFKNAQGTCDLFFVLIGTAEAPSLNTVKDLARRFQTAAENGTLAVLILSQHKAENASVQTQWDAYINQVKQLAPMIPIIDLSTAPPFAKKHHLSDSKSDIEKYIASNLMGGIQELIARIQWAQMLGGGRRTVK